MSNDTRTDKLEQMVTSAINQIFMQYRAVRGTMKHELQMTGINTIIRHNGVAGVHVHAGCKLTIQLHSTISERDGLSPAEGWRNDKVQI